MKKKMNRLGRFACMLTWMMLTALVAWGQTATTWPTNYQVTSDVTVNGSDPVVVINEDTNVTIAAGKMLTVNGRIQINNNVTLTISGSGNLIVESSSISGCISGGYGAGTHHSGDAGGSLVIDGVSVTLRYTGSSDVTSAVMEFGAITLNGGSLSATIAESAVANGTAVLVSDLITLNGGEFYTNGVANGYSKTFTRANGKYYKDNSTGKCYKGTLTFDDKEEIQGHYLMETDEFYTLTASQNNNITEVWAYINGGISPFTELPEGEMYVSPNATVSLSIDARLGYKVTGVTVKGSDNSIVGVTYDADADEWGFTMPQKDALVTIETGTANYEKLPLTWNETHTVGTGDFTIVKAYYTFTPTQNAFYNFTTDKPDDVDIFVYDPDSDLTKSSQGYPLEASKTYYVNIYPDADYEGNFTLTVTVEEPTDMVVTANKATYNGVPKYWATFFHPLSHYKLPEGAMAFYMKDNHALYLVGNDGSIIPKKTPVVIMADVSTEDTVSLSLSPVAATDVTVTDNVLQGTAAAKTLEAGETVYVMGKSGDNLGFYKYTGTEIPANKAYLNE